ncbi:MAG: cyclodeaminase [Rhodovibrionaceae bacterium]
MTITVLRETELRRCVSLDSEAVEAVEGAFRGLGEGKVVMPPILSLDIHDANGEMDVKTAYVPGLESFALKVSTGFFDNPKLGLPSLSGMMTLLSAKTGQVEAVLLDNGYLTDVRTAAAGAVAAKHLARDDAKVAGILGTGLQARLQLEALTLVRPIRKALVWGRDAGKTESFAKEMSGSLGIAVEVAESADAAAFGSDILVTTTPSRAPLLTVAGLHPGLHITAMGSDAEGKNEIAPEALAKANRVVLDRRSQCEKLGELAAALKAGAVEAEADFPELGEVILGKAPGRGGAEEITLCDLTGTGAQDTAIALYAFKRAQAQGFGTALET